MAVSPVSPAICAASCGVKPRPTMIGMMLVRVPTETVPSSRKMMHMTMNARDLMSGSTVAAPGSARPGRPAPRVATRAAGTVNMKVRMPRAA